MTSAVIPTDASNAVFVPAAHLLAEVERRPGVHHVRLPARFARAAVERFLEIHHAAGAVHEGHVGGLVIGQPLAADTWAITWLPGLGVPIRFIGASSALGPHRLFVFPLHTVSLAPADARHLLRALEDVKPLELDPSGRPYPWAPPRPRLEQLGARVSDDDDVELVDPGHLDAEPAAPAADSATDVHALAARWLASLCATAGLPIPELAVTRAHENQLGFCAGRIWLEHMTHRPLRVRLVVCPNADHAEILATLTHELAHAVAPARGHGPPFKLALIDLAARHFGDRTFAGARAQLDAPYRVLDYWIATSIRAALRGTDPPALRGVAAGPLGDDDDGERLAKILIRIKKLRGLADDQLGRPEGIAATATANDLITSYGLESYAVSIDGDTRDQLVDAFVLLADSALWRKTLAHAVARYCDVFSLTVNGHRSLHFFGRHGDVVTAEYLYSVSAERIVRACEAHLRAWKRALGRRTSSGETLREKTSFCDSAAVAFERKLDRLMADELTDIHGRARTRVDEAEEFALVEHQKRGQSWGSGGLRGYRDNAAGRALGQAMEVVRGVGHHDSGEAPRGLPHHRR